MGTSSKAWAWPLLAVATALPALADAATNAPDSNAQDPGDIIVTGTRRTERTVAQSTAPIDIISARELAASPSADLNDKLAATVPSFNVQRLPGLDGATYSRPASLRNLSPDETLVLVNGHRRHRSAYVDVVNQGAQAIDLSQISSAAIGHVEVLRDGASAQYGSDAIAGVINVIIDDKPGTELSAQVGQYYAGDGFSAQITGRTGLKLPGGGSLVVAGDVNRSNPTNRSVDSVNRIGQPSLTSFHGVYDLKLPLSDRFDLYSFGTYGSTKGWNDFSYRSAQAGDAVFGRSYYQDGANAIYPNWSLTSLYPNGFVTSFGAHISDVEITTGVKGKLADNLSIDVSGDYGRNAINYKVRNSINASLGPLSPTSFDAGTIVASEASGNIDATWLADIGLARPVSVGFGGSYRHERFQSIAGDVASYEVGPLSDLPSGSSGFPGLTPADARVTARDSQAGYLDIEADLTPRLTLGAAGRFEHFSDFGSNFSYKVSGRYQLTDAVAFRATYNTGFHAPAPGQQGFTKVTSIPDATAASPRPVLSIALVSPSDPLAVAYGGKPLKAETSRNVSAGLVLQPLPHLTVNIDYYHIRIDNRIGLTQQITLPSGSAYDRIQFLTNGYDSASDGVDVVASWSHALRQGRLGLSAAYNYNRTKITRFDPQVVTSITRDYIESARPHHTAIGTLTYDAGRFHLLGRARYYGSWVDALTFDQSPFVNQTVSPIVLGDLSATFDVTPRTQLTLGAENISGSYPDRANSILKYIGFKYQMIRAYDEDGGRWYVRVSHRF